jgi:hypothetical protein
MRILGIDPGTRKVGWAIFDTELQSFTSHGHSIFDDPDIDYRLEGIRIWLFRMLESTWRDVSIVSYEKMFSNGTSADAPLATFTWLLRIATKKSFSKDDAVEIKEIPHSLAYKLVCGEGSVEKKWVKSVLELTYNAKFSTLDESDAAAMALAAWKRGYEQKPEKKKKPRLKRVEASLHEIDDCLSS